MYICMCLYTQYIHIYIYIYMYGRFSFLLLSDFMNTWTPSAQPLWAPSGPLWAPLGPSGPP